MIMVLRNIVYGALLATGFLLPALPAARAESPYNDDEMALTESMNIAEFGISLRRDPALPPENFIISFTPLNASLSGCPPLKNISQETSFESDTVIVTLDTLSVDNTDFPYYKCNGKEMSPRADVVLNRDDLAEKQVKYMRLNSGPYRDTYDLTLTDESVTIARSEDFKSSGIMRQQTHYGVRDVMKLWFYPPGTVMLYAPGTDTANPQVAGKIYELAAARGLIPLEEIYPDFKSPLVKRDFHYYVDKTEGTSEGTFGTVNIDHTVYGLKADYPTYREIPVMAKLPGEMD
jgi:hypothetical protein